MLRTLAVLIFLTTPALAGGFDGTWRYELETKSANPICQGFGAGTIEIEDNSISGVISHAQDVFRVDGGINGAGLATFRARGNFDSANFEMTFSGNQGSGTWSSTGCDGTIVVTRK